MPAPESRTAKGRQTREAIDRAARTLFAERGFHDTTLADITAAADRSPALFYRYYADKEELLLALAEEFLNDELLPAGNAVRLPDSPADRRFFDAVVTGYWRMCKQHIGVLVAVAQLAPTRPRFAQLQNRFRGVGMDLAAATVRHAQSHGHARELDPDQVGAAIALLFENATAVFLRPGGLPLTISDTDAIATLATIWRRTVYGC
ncbi:TetR/AcrR family transcriptional regulator [Skermania piniformis]|uniref:TetR/AcrR family transcriptional regulator n=1 Tax=Skermania pinensis TaxID=39122 RepID=A0ABX8S920_9ACTN|nr:TetR/AcrR family transcriptional regulator [Skermania piniformis]QXQ14364.1 TetR/AcrR family transcriptional regulator [Skermania piniformis]